jgi:Tol biopolymer transport system component
MSTEVPSSTSSVSRRVRVLPFCLISFIVLLAVPLGLCALFLRGCANAHSRPIGQGDMTFDLSESGDMIVFNAVGTGGRDLYLLRVSDSSVTCVAATPEYEVMPSFSPDGKSLVCAAGIPGDRADHIFVRHLDGTGMRQLTRADANDSSPSVSPDGALVVFDRDKTYNWGGLGANWSGGGVICVVGMDGRNERQLSPDDTYAYRPWFLPDGQSVAYWTLSGAFSVPVDGSAAPTALSVLPGANGAIPSRDGSILVFTRGKYEGDQELWIANSDGTGERRITSRKAAYSFPLLSRENDVLYFLLGEWPDGPTGMPTHSMWRMNLYGTGLEKVAASQLFDQPLIWKPEARSD